MPSAFPWRSGASTLAGSVTLTPGSEPLRGSQGHDSTTTAVLMDELPQPVTAGPTSTTSKSKKSAVQADGPGKTLRVHWARLRQRINPDLSPSNTSQPEASQELHEIVMNGQHPSSQEKSGPVDAIVVDRSWFHDVQSSAPSQSDGEHNTRTLTHSGSMQHTVLTTNDRESIPTSTFWTSNWLLTRLRYHLWPIVFDFFCLRFSNKDAEEQYMKEYWYMNKTLSLWSSCFVILNSVLTAATLSGPPTLPDRIFYYGVTPALSIGLPILILFDVPRDRPRFYQVWVTLAVWAWTTYTFIFIWGCGFYTAKLNPPPYKTFLKCGTKDFIATFLFATALPTVGLFGLGMKRISALIGVLWTFILGCVLILRWRLPWYRNLIQTLVYHCFIIYLHYARESAERRLHSMRDNLKMQYKATQKAQVNERNAAESKRRLTSYIFHEVRVPLNSALLAVQNMAAAGVFRKSHELEFTALEGSLSMMSKVLNDMLDFNRLDAGKFENVVRPFSFHQVLRTLCVPLRMATDARGLELIVELDPFIDQFARRATGESEDAIRARPQDPGIMVGDEMRLRQIVNNLASNACKFTPSGGKITVRTKLVWPTPGSISGPMPVLLPNNSQSQSQGKGQHRSTSNAAHAQSRTSSRGASTDGKTNGAEAPLSDDALISHNAWHEGRPPLDRLIVRIEVHDTGVGIQSDDIAQSKLFSPFNQTEQGRLQGGKGTGLGLALVRQIVKRSGGRLGVYSAGVNEGSTFWVELMLVVGPSALVGTADADAALIESCMRVDSQLGESSMPVHVKDEKDESEHPDPQLATRPPQAMMSESVVGSLVGDAGTMVVCQPTVDEEEPNPVLARMAVLDAVSPAAVEDKSPFFEPTTPSTSTDSGAVSTPSSERPVSSHAPAAPPVEPMSVVPMLRLGLGDLKLPTPHNAITAPPGQPARSISDPLPAPPDSPPAPTAVAQQTWPPGMPVLVVDDDSLTRQLMRRLLQRLGCHVSTAHNGQMALEMLMNLTPRSEEALSLGGHGTSGSTAETPPWWTDHERFSVVFLDNMMPVLSGVEAVAKLRAAGRKDFVVGVTGNALLSDQQEYSEAGADIVLTKPVFEKTLRQVLSLADERRRKWLSGQQRGSDDPSPVATSDPSSKAQ